MKTKTGRVFALALYVFLFSVVFVRIAFASDPNTSGPLVPKEAAGLVGSLPEGSTVRIIRRGSSSESAAASGPSSSASGDGLKQSVTGTAPDLALSVGGHAKGGDTKASSQANAFSPFDPSGSNLAGWSFIAIGIAIFIGSKFFPLLPQSAGFLSIGVGMVLIVAPTFLNQNPWIGMLIVGVLGLVCLFVVGYKAKWFDAQIGPEVQQRLEEKGQKVAAGALAHLEANAPFASARKVKRAAATVAKAKASKP